MIKRCKRWKSLTTLVRTGLVLLPLLMLAPPLLSQEESKEEQARRVLKAAIEAMGGDRYLAVKTEHVTGREFLFQKDRRSGLIPFQSWSVYKRPVLFRYQAFKGKRQSLQVVNLELGKGWQQEGYNDAKELPQEALDQFKVSVKQDIHYILRNRLDEEGISFFYFGPEDIAGSGELEAVQLIDETNVSVVLYFNRTTHLPVHTEGNFRDRLGLRHERRTEFYNWHEHEGVLTFQTIHEYEDDEKSREMFLEEVSYNIQIPPDYFLKPELPPEIVEKQQKKKAKQQKKAEAEKED